jgi:hypothetical protein
MLLTEITELHDSESLFSIMANRLLKKHTIKMWVLDRDGGDVEVEVESVEDTLDGWVKVHYGVPNSRTGDINQWESLDFDANKVTISQEGKEWWLHET